MMSKHAVCRFGTSSRACNSLWGANYLSGLDRGSKARASQWSCISASRRRCSTDTMHIRSRFSMSVYTRHYFGRNGLSPYSAQSVSLDQPLALVPDHCSHTIDSMERSASDARLALRIDPPGVLHSNVASSNHDSWWVLYPLRLSSDLSILGLSTDVSSVWARYDKRNAG